MEKMLYVTDAVKLNMQCLDFACYLCNLTHSKLTGIFLENLEQEARSVATIRERAVSSAIPGASVRELKENYCEENILAFKRACEARGVNSTVHRDRGVPITEIVAESRFADLIVIDASTSFSDERETVPTAFVKEVLQDTECPVVIATESFEGIDEIVFTCDHSRSSVFAIKQFTYLFPELRDRRALILSVTEPGKAANSDKYKLKEWLKAHYDHTDQVVLEDGNTRARLLEYLLGRNRVFIVMGAYGRGMMSSFFSPSHATPVVKVVTQPVFIAHH
ncbi:universal stress protein [Chitinophaga japonensis]|uniref:Nucleotide-binding universal stress UspA family protein n=1 Tax=Chitinophaga japonensis TaxID=104662 RepID=A0A562SSA4_CHIJA|nr:universal stress protein [Chitinophaga japonensis]TWI84125.1 hypothetical protein LX66_4487 [Chitinophaga japonensis]